jgi:hypothetical protein
MKHILLVSIFTLAFSQLFPCSCFYQKRITKKQVRQYQTIATGTILKIEERDEEKLITFQVETAYKGTQNEVTIEISTASDGGMCGISVQEGEQWLMFTYDTKNGLYTDLCTRSRNMERDYNQKRVRKDLKYLKKRRKKLLRQG